MDSHDSHIKSEQPKKFIDNHFYIFFFCFCLFRAFISNILFCWVTRFRIIQFGWNWITDNHLYKIKKNAFCVKRGILTSKIKKEKQILFISIIVTQSWNTRWRLLSVNILWRRMYNHAEMSSYSPWKLSFYCNG